METVAFRLPEPLKERIVRYAESINESKSVAGRELLQDAFDAQDQIDRLKAENEQLREKNQELREDYQTDSLASAIMILGAFILGSTATVSINIPGITAGIAGITLLVLGTILAYVGIGTLTDAYGRVFTDEQ